ncbi:MAG: hypothetical protein LBP36_02250 [Oscillospiraceae bacterium]|jgi:hypothetical protein|nr:hypothetical protein [Oscillospiraceae bacterium]
MVDQKTRRKITEDFEAILGSERGAEKVSAARGIPDMYDICTSYGGGYTLEQFEQFVSECVSQVAAADQEDIVNAVGAGGNMGRNVTKILSSTLAAIAGLAPVLGGMNKAGALDSGSVVSERRVDTKPGSKAEGSVLSALGKRVKENRAAIVAVTAATAAAAGSIALNVGQYVHGKESIDELNRELSSERQESSVLRERLNQLERVGRVNSAEADDLRLRIRESEAIIENAKRMLGTDLRENDPSLILAALNRYSETIKVATSVGNLRDICNTLSAYMRSNRDLIFGSTSGTGGDMPAAIAAKKLAGELRSSSHFSGTDSVMGEAAQLCEGEKIEGAFVSRDEKAADSFADSLKGVLSSESRSVLSERKRLVVDGILAGARTVAEARSTLKSLAGDATDSSILKDKLEPIISHRLKDSVFRDGRSSEDIELLFTVWAASFRAELIKEGLSEKFDGACKKCHVVGFDMLPDSVFEFAHPSDGKNRRLVYRDNNSNEALAAAIHSSSVNAFLYGYRSHHFGSAIVVPDVFAESDYRTKGKALDGIGQKVFGHVLGTIKGTLEVAVKV